jgi:hypothetical protein
MGARRHRVSALDHLARVVSAPRTTAVSHDLDVVACGSGRVVGSCLARCDRALTSSLAPPPLYENQPLYEGQPQREGVRPPGPVFWLSRLRDPRPVRFASMGGCPAEPVREPGERRFAVDLVESRIRDDVDGQVVHDGCPSSGAVVRADAYRYRAASLTGRTAGVTESGRSCRAAWQPTGCAHRVREHFLVLDSYQRRLSRRFYTQTPNARAVDDVRS